MFARYASQIALVSAILLGLNCGGGSQKSKDIKAITRDSNQIEKKLLKKENLDFAPQLTADGSTAVFIGGRKVGESVQLRAHLFTVGQPESDSNPVTVFSADSDYGDEKEVDISSGGTYALVAYLKNGQNDLAVQFLKGDRKFVQLTENPDVESAAAISSDEKIIAFSIGTVGSLKSSLYVASVNASAQTIAAPVKVDSVKPFNLGPVWLKGSNVLLVVRFNETTGAVEGQTISFADPSNLTAVTSNDLTIKSEGASLPKVDRSGTVDASSDTFYFTELLAPNAANKVNHAGDNIQETSFYLRQNRIGSFPAATGNPTKAINPNGFSVVSFSATAGGLVLSTVRQFASCTGIKDPYFAMSLQLIDSASSVRQILPLFFRKTQEPEQEEVRTATEEVCKFQTPPQDRPVDVDTHMRDAVINSAATKDKFTIVYTTRLAVLEDGKPTLLGDDELYVINYDQGKYTNTQLRKNSN